jgi:hypothetical protein
MTRKRALILAACVVAIIATGTAAAAANFGLLGANNDQLPAGDLDLATVRANAKSDTATSDVATTRVDVENGVVHIYQPDGTEITVPVPAASASPPVSGQTTPVTTPGEDDHGGQGDDD